MYFLRKGSVYNQLIFSFSFGTKLFGSISNSSIYKFHYNIHCFQIFQEPQYTNKLFSFIDKQNLRRMKFEFLRPDYIFVGRENSKVSFGWHTLVDAS